MIGIYKITNTLNNKCYIGCSTDIENRWKSHRQRAFVEGKEFDKPLYRAFRKYGIENFKFEVLSECKKEELGELEKVFIQYYNSYKNGYNATVGGDIGGFDRAGEKHPNHKLTTLDVVGIRIRYMNGDRKSNVYGDYAHLIGASGFSKVWKGETWKDVMPQVYTIERAINNLTNTSNPGSKNGKAKLTEQDVFNIRLQKKNGLSKEFVYNQFKDKLSKGSFTNVWCGYNWKHIIV